MKKQWNVAIYARVSTDKKEQQESIPAQIDSLKHWLYSKMKIDKACYYKLIDIYEDQGFSGSSFHRDSFIRMKEDVDKKKINMILTRDLSRFSRNYIMAGYYLEEYFQLKGIRFVSVLDNVDTIEEYNDIIPFKNILNEMYVKDCSRRTKDGIMQRMLRGSCISSRPPYGFRFKTTSIDSKKHVQLIKEDNGTEKIVKKIFKLYLDGYGFQKIANYLNLKLVPPPTSSGDGLWTNNTIRYILTNPKYAGIMAQHRWSKVNYKIKKVVEIPREEWIIGEKYKGIIDKKTFEKVQKTIANRKKNYRYKGDIHLFSSVLFCNECKAPMYYRKSYKGYKCKNSQIGGKICTAHSIKEEILLEEISKRIQQGVDKKEYKHIINFKEFKRSDIEELVDKIIVHEDKLTGDKEIKIYFKFSLV